MHEDHSFNQQLYGLFIIKKENVLDSVQLKIMSEVLLLEKGQGSNYLLKHLHIAWMS